MAWGFLSARQILLSPCSFPLDSPTAVDINSYYLTTPNDPADFSDHNQGCSPTDHDSFPGQSVVICTGQQQVLTDRFTEASIPPAPYQYVGWDRNQEGLDGFTIVIDSDHTRLTRIDIRFYHNPSAGIGLPEVSSIYVFSSKASNTFANPLSFVYARNEDLAQSDNRMRTVSIIITDDNLDSIGFYQFVMVNFVYSSSTIERAQLVEMWGYGGTGEHVHNLSRPIYVCNLLTLYSTTYRLFLKMFA